MGTSIVLVIVLLYLLPCCNSVALLERAVDYALSRVGLADLSLKPVYFSLKIYGVIYDKFTNHLTHSHYHSRNKYQAVSFSVSLLEKNRPGNEASK